MGEFVVKGFDETSQYLVSICIQIVSFVSSLAFVRVLILTSSLQSTDYRYSMPLYNWLKIGSPALQTLIPSVAAAYVIQLGVALPSIFFQTDRFYGTYC